MEAADNVVHAYDLDMTVPMSPKSPVDEDARVRVVSQPLDQVDKDYFSARPDSGKRKRSSSASYGGPTKYQATSSSFDDRRRNANLQKAVLESICERTARTHHEPERTSPGSVPQGHEPSISASVRHFDLRELLHYVVNESLKIGGRPESAVAQQTEGGETIDVWTRKSDGEAKRKIIDWSVDPAVPDTLFSAYLLNSEKNPTDETH